MQNAGLWVVVMCSGPSLTCVLQLITLESRWYVVQRTV